MGLRLCDEAVVFDGAEEAVPGGHQGAAAPDRLGDGAGFAGTAGKGLGMSLLSALFGPPRAMPTVNWHEYYNNPYSNQPLAAQMMQMWPPARPMVAGDLDASHPFPLSPDGGPYRREMVEGDL